MVKTRRFRTHVVHSEFDSELNPKSETQPEARFETEETLMNTNQQEEHQITSDEDEDPEESMYEEEEHEESMDEEEEESQVCKDEEEPLISMDQEEEEGDTVILINQSGERRSRKETTLARLCNLPKGERVLVSCNNQNQPVGEEGGLLSQFLGIMARSGDLPLEQHDWRLVPKEFKLNVLKQVKSKFQYPPCCQKWILQSVARKWKAYKCDLKALYFKEGKALEEQRNNIPPNVSPDQWARLVAYWRSDLGKKRSVMSKKARSFQKVCHTAGTKSFARIREEMKHKREDKMEPSRAEVYLQVYKRKDGTYQDEATCSKMQEKLCNQQKPQNSPGSIAWEGDAFSQVIGKDKYGRIRGLGLGPTPTELWGPSYSQHLKDVQMTQEKVDLTVESITQLKTSNSEKSHKIMELEAKMAQLEERFNEHRESTRHLEDVRKLQEKMDQVLEIVEQLRTSDSKKSCKILELEAKHEQLDRKCNEHQGSSRQNVEAEMKILSQKRRIEELEAQLAEAEGIIVDLRAELKVAFIECEKIKRHRIIRV